MPGAQLNALLNLASGAVALLVSYSSYRTNRLLLNSLLRYISIGFMLLGFGLILQAFTQLTVGLTPVEVLSLKGLQFTEFLIYITLQLVAYVVFAWGYGRSTFRKPVQQAAAPIALAIVVRRPAPLFLISLAVYLTSQLGIVLLLAFVVFQGLLNFTRTKSTLALMVLFGFMLIFLAHIMTFISLFDGSGMLYLLGNGIQFCGFLALLFFLFWSGRVGTT